MREMFPHLDDFVVKQIGGMVHLQMVEHTKAPYKMTTTVLPITEQAYKNLMCFTPQITEEAMKRHASGDLPLEKYNKPWRGGVLCANEGDVFFHARELHSEMIAKDKDELTCIHGEKSDLQFPVTKPMVAIKIEPGTEKAKKRQNTDPREPPARQQKLE